MQYHNILLNSSKLSYGRIIFVYLKIKRQVNIETSKPYIKYLHNLSGSVASHVLANVFYFSFDRGHPVVLILTVVYI